MRPAAACQQAALNANDIIASYPSHREIFLSAPPALFARSRPCAVPSEIAYATGRLTDARRLTKLLPESTERFFEPHQHEQRFFKWDKALSARANETLEVATCS